MDFMVVFLQSVNFKEAGGKTTKAAEKATKNSTAMNPFLSGPKTIRMKKVKLMMPMEVFLRMIVNGS